MRGKGRSERDETSYTLHIQDKDNKEELQSPVDKTWIVIPFEMKCQTNFTLKVITLRNRLYAGTKKNQKIKKKSSSSDDILEIYMKVFKFYFDTTTFRIDLFGSVLYILSISKLSYGDLKS